MTTMSKSPDTPNPPEPTAVGGASYRAKVRGGARSTFLAWCGLGIGWLGTCFVAMISYPLFSIHHDIGGGGAVWLGLVVLAAGVTFLFGLPCAIYGIVKGERLIGWLGVIFAIAPVPLGLAMLKTAMALNGFHCY
jgi:hypothetical protein